MNQNAKNAKIYPILGKKIQKILINIEEVL